MSTLLFERSIPGRRTGALPRLTPDEEAVPRPMPDHLLRTEEAALPELSELDVVRHFVNLSRQNMSVDANFYPLGSCTMKYNSKACERMAALDDFLALHPVLPQLRDGAKAVQGALQVLYETERLLCEILGMDAFTLQPLAGAHGELTGMMLITAYHRHHGRSRSRVLIPDSAHGTNPASAAIAGYTVTSVPTGPDGGVDFDAFEAALDDDVAAVMLTCPNTLGLFERDILRMADAAHQRGALLYYDGANLNALLGRARPGDLGFDVVHVNLHKTFGTPHGGGGPGAGPVGVKDHLVPFLPASRMARRADGTFALDYDLPQSIGYIAPFYGNFAVIVRAYVYMLLLGSDGLRRVSENAVLSANYVQERLRDLYTLPFDRRCMHECVFSATRQSEQGVRALDIAKALIDEGLHPPTVYFPLTVPEALMIEPTETESKEEVDRFIDVMRAIAERAKRDPESFRDQPRTMPVGRLDEVKAARDMRFRA